MNITPNNCPACLFGPWIIPFGKFKGSRIAQVERSYLDWLCDNGYLYVVLQELWHDSGHIEHMHPDVVLGGSYNADGNKIG